MRKVGSGEVRPEGSRSEEVRHEQVCPDEACPGQARRDQVSPERLGEKRDTAGAAHVGTTEDKTSGGDILYGAPRRPLFSAARDAIVLKDSAIAKDFE